MSTADDLGIAAISQSHERLSMVVFMGTTGSGKSYLINRLAGYKAVEEGATLDSCTQFCQMVLAELGSTKVLLIDTPGFDDTTRPDSEILTEIAKLLSAQYKLGVDLKGVIYVHRITDIRYGGSSVKTFEICQRVCGDVALTNVLLVTSRWHEVDPVLGSDRERQLRTKFWAYMLNKGSQMSRFHGDRDSAIALVSQLLSKDAVVLELHKELVDGQKHLDDTAAGSYVSDNYEHIKSKCEDELRALEKLKKHLADDRVILRQYQQDVAAEKAGLKGAHEQQVSLHKPINAEVDNEIQSGRFQFRSLLAFVPTVLSILGMFVGIPPGVTDIFSSWMAN